MSIKVFNDLNELESFDGDGICLYSGFYSVEKGFVWSTASSTLYCKGHVHLAIGNWLSDETIVRVVKVGLNGKCYKAVIDSRIKYKLSTESSDVLRVDFEADGSTIPSAIGFSKDNRELSFRIVFENNQTKGAVPLPLDTNSLIFSYSNKKHLESQFPVYVKAKERGLSCQILHVDDTIQVAKHSGSKIHVFVVSSPETHQQISEHINGGIYIYLEHGAAPLKKYSYGGHYCRYDLILTVGELWQERLHHLYPKLKGRCKVVGYPKVKDVSFASQEARAVFYESYQLDSSLPLVLFAPTWSGGDRDAGIFNSVHLKNLNANLIVIPHEDDKHYSSELIEKGYKVVLPKSHQSISNFYPYADVLVSDISSTAAEFAALGGITICMMPNKIQDFDTAFIKEGALFIPFTNHKWDFCSLVKPCELAEAINNILEDIQLHRSVILKSSQEKVKKFLFDIGDKAAERAVDEIVSFLDMPLGNFMK
jgi:hypothetical protein